MKKTSSKLEDPFSKFQMSHEKDPVDIPLYCLVNRDPYNGLL